MVIFHCYVSSPEGTWFFQSSIEICTGFDGNKSTSFPSSMAPDSVANEPRHHEPRILRRSLFRNWDMLPPIDQYETRQCWGIKLRFEDCLFVHNGIESAMDLGPGDRGLAGFYENRG